jgi:hypothetical protein
MTLLGLIVLVFVAGLAVYVGVTTVRRRHTPPEIRGDWWPVFEREFREYARQVSNSKPNNGRRRGDRGSTGR